MQDVTVEWTLAQWSWAVVQRETRLKCKSSARVKIVLKKDWIVKKVLFHKFYLNFSWMSTKLSGRKGDGKSENCSTVKFYVKLLKLGQIFEDVLKIWEENKTGLSDNFRKL